MNDRFGLIIADQPLHSMTWPTIVNPTGRNDAFTKVATQWLRTIYEEPKSNPATA